MKFMKTGEIYEILNAAAPFCDAEAWDNSGLMLGSLDDEISKIYLSLDVTSELVREAEAGSLFVVHHPLIFSPLKSLDPQLYPANLIYEMIRKNISLIAMHTNFDKHVLNGFVARKILKFEVTDEREFLVFMRADLSFEQLCAQIKRKLGIEHLRAVKTKNFIQNIALCTGSGSELNQSLGVDCFITGDIKYHVALQNLENGVSLIDINHFESERYFGRALAPFLQKSEIEVIISEQKNPFTYY